MNKQLTLDEIKDLVIFIEKNVHLYMSQKVEPVRRSAGHHIADEVILSVAALAAARAVASKHLWSNESIESISKRFTETMQANIQISLNKLLREMGDPEVAEGST